MKLEMATEVHSSKLFFVHNDAFLITIQNVLITS